MRERGEHEEEEEFLKKAQSYLKSSGVAGGKGGRGGGVRAMFHSEERLQDY